MLTITSRTMLTIMITIIIVCASRHPPRPLAGVVAWRIRGQEDLKDFGMETLPRTVPEPTPRGLGGPEIHLGATKVNWLITKSGPRVTQQRPRAPQDCFKSVQEDPIRG